MYFWERAAYNGSGFSFGVRYGVGVSLGEDAWLVKGAGVSLTMSAVGQADDTALVANSRSSHNCLLKLYLAFYKKYHVSLSPGKTKLQVMHTRDMKARVDYEVATVKVPYF